MKKFIFALAFLSTMFSAGAASANNDCTFSTPAVADPSCSVEVQPVTLEPSDTQTLSAPTAPGTNPAVNSQLPVTGVETVSIALFGALMVAGGVVLVGRSRQADQA